MNAVIQRHEPRVKPWLALDCGVELTQLVDIFRAPVGRTLSLFEYDPGVGVRVICHDTPAEDVVGDDEAAGAEKAAAAGSLRGREDGGEVGRVARLLGVDEDEVVGLVGVQLGKAVRRSVISWTEDRASAVMFFWFVQRENYRVGLWGWDGDVTYVSRASPTTTDAFLMPLAAQASSARFAYSALNSRPVTVPSGPTAWDQTMPE